MKMKVTSQTMTTKNGVMMRMVMRNGIVVKKRMTIVRRERMTV